MEKIYKLVKILIDELGNSKTCKTGELQAGELEALKTLSVTAEKLYKLCKLAEGDGGYSGDGMWEATMNGTYGRGNSYDGVDGNYSGRRGQRRNSRGQYSRDGYSMGGKVDEMIEHVNEMMEIAPDDRTRDMIRRFKETLERA